MPQAIENTGAGEGNRTLVLSLEGFSSTIELHPQNPTPAALAATAFNLVEGEGFEPSKAEPTDLQSVPVDRLGIPPEEPEIIRTTPHPVNTQKHKSRHIAGFYAKTGLDYFSARTQAASFLASSSVTLFGGIGI